MIDSFMPSIDGFILPNITPKCRGSTVEQSIKMDFTKNSSLVGEPWVLPINTNVEFAHP
jgi:hypothetical protein